MDEKRRRAPREACPALFLIARCSSPSGGFLLKKNGPVDFTTFEVLH
jgi:hypothetical protein